MAQLDQAESVFAAVRSRLFGIAYRMTGSVADAEDLVQEVWVVDRREPGGLGHHVSQR